MISFTVKLALEPDGKKIRMVLKGGGLGNQAEQRFAEHLVQALIEADKTWCQQNGLPPSTAKGFVIGVDPKEN